MTLPRHIKNGILLSVKNMQTTRLFEILYILLNRERVTAKELADRFEVSTRTIYRDIDALGIAGVPIYTEKGKGGGISLMPDFVMNKSMLNEAEQQEVLSSLQGLAQLNMVQTDTTIEKLSATFNKTATDWLEVDFSEWESNNTQIFATLKEAILQHQIIEFDYLTSDGGVTHRQVEPVKLWFKSRSWYLKTFCLLRQNPRTFKLTRIRNLVLTDLYFPEREIQLNPEQVDTEPSAPMIDFKLKIDPAAAYRIFDDFGNSELQPDGSYLVDVSWVEDDWIYGLILSYGEYIEVIGPPQARETFCRKVEKINKKYVLEVRSRRLD